MKWIFSLLFLCFQSLCYSQLSMQPGEWQFIQPITWEYTPNTYSKAPNLSLVVNVNLKNVKPSLTKARELEELSKSCFYNTLGHFCKIELQIEKAVRVPFKFRLGEVQYTEQLEKPN